MLHRVLVLACATTLPACARWVHPDPAACWGTYAWQDFVYDPHYRIGDVEHIVLHDDGTYVWGYAHHALWESTRHDGAGTWRTAPGGVRLTGSQPSTSRYFLVTHGGRAWLLGARGARDYCADWVADADWEDVPSREIDPATVAPPTLESFCEGLGSAGR